jgi:hypothetical protein
VIDQSRQAIVCRLHAQRFTGVHQLLVQFENAVARAQPDTRLVRMEWLREIVVGARIHTVYQVLSRRAGGQQDHVDVRLARCRANALADFDPVEPEHHPVQDGEPRRVLRLQDVPRLQTVARHHRVVSPFRQHGAQYGMKYRIVFSRENFQPAGDRLQFFLHRAYRRETGSRERLVAALPCGRGSVTCCKYWKPVSEPRAQASGSSGFSTSP